MSRVVGIDFGQKRVGLALADPLRLFAATYGTFDQAGAIAALRALDEHERIDTIVLGWPLTPEGEEGLAVSLVDAFARRLERDFPDVRLVRWDERYSSVEARELLVTARVPKKQRRDKGRLDAAAAAVILQQYLDSRPSHSEQ